MTALGSKSKIRKINSSFKVESIAWAGILWMAGMVYLIIHLMKA